jgi:hypothetical protein
MLPVDPVLHRQVPVIQKIIQDETWLEGERRGCWVPSNDRVVRENVCRVILRVGQEMRETITRQLPPQERALAMSITTAAQPVWVLEGLDWEI